MSILSDIPASYYALVTLAIILAVFVVPYVIDPYHLRRPTIQGPKLAAMSNAWLAYAAAKGNRSERVHRLHQRYGKLVRLTPNQVSVADPKALEVVYAHGSGSTLKTDFYDAFVSIQPAIFTTRSRIDHARKRKMVSSTFSQQNVLLFEPQIRRHVRAFCAQWDMRCARAAASNHSGASDGKAVFDSLPDFNFLAFDVISDLAFGAPFGMIAAQKDSAPVLVRTTAGEKPEIAYVPAIQVLHERGGYLATMAVIPVWLRSWAKYIPWCARGQVAKGNFIGMAYAAVERRLKFGISEEDLDEEGESSGKKRADILEKLMQGKDETGNPMSHEELTAEALQYLTAGSDTTSASACAITYYLAANPRVQQKLQAELDSVLPATRSPHPALDQRGTAPLPPTSVTAKHVDIKALPYLQACINEGLRVNSTSALGLPRVVPPGSSIEVCGEVFGAGTILSVPSYTIHRMNEVWGEDADTYRPERWLEREVGREYNPFSFGPRACVGRNLASMELLIIIASIFHRYEFELVHPKQKLMTSEGFLRKPLEVIWSQIMQEIEGVNG